MKKLFLTALALSCAVGVFAQGTVQFNNRVLGVVTTHVYFSYQYLWVNGNGPNDTPPGTTDWTGWTLLTGSGFRAAIRGANGADQPVSSLSFGANPTVTSFRTGTAAGGFAITTATLNSVAKDAAVATLQVFAWDARTGIVMPDQALVAWQSGLIFAGFSNPFNVSGIGGDVNTPPALSGLQSFGFFVPEPNAISIAVLATAGFLTFRRKQTRPPNHRAGLTMKALS